MLDFLPGFLRCFSFDPLQLPVAEGGCPVHVDPLEIGRDFSEKAGSVDAPTGGNGLNAGIVFKLAPFF